MYSQPCPDTFYQECALTRVHGLSANASSPAAAVLTPGNFDELSGEPKIILPVFDDLRPTPLGVELGPCVTVQTVALLACMPGT